MLVLGEDPTGRSDKVTITAIAKYSINFIKWKNNFDLFKSLHYNGVAVLLCHLSKNISIQSRRFKYKTISIVFRQ